MENKILQEYISKRIRLLRLEKGLTQEQLEEKADLGKTMFINWKINQQISKLIL